ncbi:putative membrane protein [Haloferax volcanii]|uniref:VanZ-like domain-containing protein n=3 Tax=Haloferax volcanii TaxID=2246 RepID=M0GX79_HALL2|nr:hypothetical protein C456_04041 [Haloferax lucentense DSM 14919]WEL30725.1 putative membrane protein [Haloferax alexandrinus]
MDSVRRAEHPGQHVEQRATMSHSKLAREPWLWAFVGVWAAVVSALHFGGLAYDIYTRIWWWDVLTHSLSGFGVAGVLFLVFPQTFRGARAPAVVAATLLAIGAGFEVYEYLFKDFWWGWSMAYYAEDTAIDLVVNVAGGLGFFAFVEGIFWSRGQADARRGDSPPRSTHVRSDGGETPDDDRRSNR